MSFFFVFQKATFLSLLDPIKSSISLLESYKWPWHSRRSVSSPHWVSFTKLESKSSPPHPPTPPLSFCRIVQNRFIVRPTSSGAGGLFRWRILQRRRISPDLSCNIVQNRAAPNLYSGIGFPLGQRCTFQILILTKMQRRPMKHVKTTPFKLLRIS